MRTALTDTPSTHRDIRYEKGTPVKFPPSTQHSRTPRNPRSRGLELRCQSEQRRFIAIARYALHGERQPARALRKRQHDGGLTGEIEPDGERREREYAAPIFIDIVHHHIEPAELHGH